MVDALGVVDEDREALRVLQLDREHLDAWQGRLDLALDLLRQCPLLLIRGAHRSCSFNKNGRGAPISTYLKCGDSSVATDRPFGLSGIRPCRARGRRRRR